MKLVIAGKKDSNEIDLLKNKLNLEKKITKIISLDDEEIINLYKYAKLFIFPSLYEGFGLLPFQTIACGCPTITSNISILKEFNPYSIDDYGR